ncbi:MAG: hypothetical protein K2K79_08445 [Paramuribaculum sp.]|nr:hypothetical protein [Paramuribaculum sp.]
MNRILKSVLLILCLVIFIPAKCQNSTIDNRSEDTIKYRSIYKNSNSTFNWYIIDTLAIDEYTLIRDEFNRDFIITGKVQFDSLSTNLLLNATNVFLTSQNIFVDWGLAYMSLDEYIAKFDKYITKDDKTTEHIIITKQIYNIYNRPYSIIEYYVRPKKFMFFLMTGKAYNNIIYDSVLDGDICKPLDFPDENAYYKVLVPLWQK